MDSFEMCLSWGFQNTPNMLKLIEFWLRYLRSKTNDMILKISSKLIKIDESSGRADSKTVPGFAFRATFEVDIEGFTPVKVMVATTVWSVF